MKKECVVMLLAGGQGSRLYALTSKVAKPAVPFGGKFRIIDFPLSNCANSGFHTVGVLTQYQPLELNSYIGSGQPWDLDRSDGGVHILPPYVRSGDCGTWYSGTANAIYQNIGFLEHYDPDYILVLSGDHIYKMDFSELLNHHKKSGATCTIAALHVPLEEAHRFGILGTDEQNRIISFQEKPKHPKGTLASMGIYMFNWPKLKMYLEIDEADPKSSHDFGHDVLPHMLQAGELLSAYPFSGYWKDVGTIDSLWDANMDLLSARTGGMLFDPNWPIYTRSHTRPPHFVGNTAQVTHSLLTGGCQVEGFVENSVLFHSVTVERGAQVRYSILMPGTIVKAGAVVKYAVLAEHAVVGAGAQVGTEPDGSPDWGITVVASDVSLGDGICIDAHAMVTDSVPGGKLI